MTTDRELMQQALDALEAMNPYPASKEDQRACAIAALRARLAEPETCKPALQVEEVEPVAWRFRLPSGKQWHFTEHRPHEYTKRGLHFEPLYPAPPARRPLTDEAIWRQYQALWPFHPADEPRLAEDIVKFARAIERAHKIGGNDD